MSTEEGVWLSAAELAEYGKVGIPGLPGTSRGCRDKAEREGWPAEKVPGKGGPGGTKTIYEVPRVIARAIRASDGMINTSSFLPDLDPSKVRGLVVHASGAGKTGASQQSLRNEAVHDHQPYGEVDPLLLEKVVGQMLRYLEENKDRVRIDVERQAALIAILYRWAAKSGGISDEEFLQLMRAAA